LFDEIERCVLCVCVCVCVGGTAVQRAQLSHLKRKILFVVHVHLVQISV